MDSQLKTEQARGVKPLRTLLVEYGDGPREGESFAGFKCPFCVDRASIKERRTGKISELTIEQIKTQTDIVEVIGRKVPLKHSGGAWVGLCPFHKEKSPSFNVVPGKKLYHCFGCGKGGDVIGFISDFDGIKFVEAVQRLAAERGIQIEYERKPGDVIECSNQHCKAAKGLDEAGYLALKHECSRKDAWVIWIRMAGVWKEADEYSKSIRPGGVVKRKNRIPTDANGGSAGESSKLKVKSSKSAEAPIVAIPETKEFPQQIAAAAPSLPQVDGAPPTDAEITPASLPMESNAPPDESPIIKAAAPASSAGAAPLSPDSASVSRAVTSEPGLPARAENVSARETRALPGANEFPVQPGSPRSEEAGGAEVGSAAAQSHAPPPADQVSSQEAGVGNQESGGNGNGGDDDEEGKGDESSDALREFWERCQLDDETAQKILIERGWPAEVSRMMGLKSNRRDNVRILDDLATKYPMDDLVEAGLFVRYATGSEHANKQYYGWGILGKAETLQKRGQKLSDTAKVTDRGEVWDWTYPILIPYFNEFGKLVSLRPHKGGAAGQPARLYVPRVVGEVQSSKFKVQSSGEEVQGETPSTATAPTSPRPSLPAEREKKDSDGRFVEEFETVVITEGELKAIALWYLLDYSRGHASHRKIGACAIPGISQGKNPEMQWEMFSWLRRTKARRVVVGFDSEEKGDPKLPGFKANPDKRFEAEYWARYLARLVEFRCKNVNGEIAHIPKAWRDEKGKADWDGILARALSGKIAPSGADGGSKFKVQSSKLAEESNPSPTLNVKPGTFNPASSREKTLNWIRQEIKAVIDGARSASDSAHIDFFDSAEERIIKRNVDRLWFDPKLPYGGHREERLAMRLRRAASERAWMFSGMAYALAEAFDKTKGWLYERKLMARMKDTMAVEFENQAASCRSALEQPMAEKNRRMYRDRLTFFEEYRNGFPNLCANFEVLPQFVLVRREGGLEKRDRIVILKNNAGERSKLVPLPSRSISTPHAFKEWLPDQGRFDFIEGEKALRSLVYDIHQRLIGNDVYQIAHIGWHEGPKLWVYGDCAVSDPIDDKPGEFVVPDENNILWHNGFGYQMSESDWENQEFKMGKPRLQPMLVLGFSGQVGDDQVEYALKEGVEDDLEAIRDLFAGFSRRMKETISGEFPTYEGYLAIGSSLSYFAAPEFFRRHGFFSGIWIHGEKGSGKNLVSLQMMRLHGYDDAANLNLSSTRTGLQIALQQYCNLPVRFDEANNLPDDKIEVLKSAHDRTTIGKFETDGKSRRAATAPIIMGEHTSTNAALRQRNPHILVSSERRIKLNKEPINHKDWFDRNQDFFFQSGVISCAGANNSWSGRSAVGRNGATGRKWRRRTTAARACTGWPMGHSWRRPRCWGATAKRNWQNSGNGCPAMP